MLRKLALVAACVASASAFTAPVGLTRASGALAKADAFAAKPALPVVAAVERKNAATSLKMSCTTARTMKTRQQPHRKRCMLLDKIANNKMTVSFSHRRHHDLGLSKWSRRKLMFELHARECWISWQLPPPCLLQRPGRAACLGRR